MVLCLVYVMYAFDTWNYFFLYFYSFYCYAFLYFRLDLKMEAISEIYRQKYFIVGQNELLLLKWTTMFLAYSLTGLEITIFLRLDMMSNGNQFGSDMITDCFFRKMGQTWWQFLWTCSVLNYFCKLFSYYQVQCRKTFK